LSSELELLRQRIAELEQDKDRLTKALEQSEDLSRKIFHASSNMMAIHSLKDWSYVDVNEAGTSFGGFTREELIGRTMDEYRLLEDPSSQMVVARKLKEEGKVHNMELRVRTKDGDWRTVLFSADPITFNNKPCMLAVSVDITEREQEADALKQSEEKYRKLVEHSLQGLSIGQDMRFVYCNNAFLKMFGYTEKELLALSPREVEAMVHPDDRKILSERYRDQLAGKSISPRFEFRALKKDGTEIVLEMHTSLVEFNGKPAIQGICMDITERKKAENALRESEERFRMIAETMDEIFWIFDVDQKVATYLSPAFDRIWGFSRSRVVDSPEPIWDPVHPEDRELVHKVVDLMAAGRLHDYEYRIIRPDGSIRYLWNRGFPVKDKNGRIIRYIGVTQDVTEWRQAEEALKESREYLNQIINCIGDPIFVKDREHRIVLVNDAMCTFAGLPHERLIGSSEIPEAVAAIIWEQEESVFRTGKEHVSEDTLVDGQGVNRTLLTKKSPLTDKNGKKQIVGVLRDITEYKRLESQFLQAQKMEAIGVLAGGVAHDFNNLLNVINGYAELMMDGMDLDNPMVKDLEQIREAGRRAAALTSQLLAFGRKQIMQPEIFDLNKVISGMQSMLSRMIGEDIEIGANFHPDPMLINADPGKIQQVVMNLVVNARDAMPNGGQLTIQTTRVDFEESYIKEHTMTKPGPYVMLAISDNGIGMDTETQARIFEPFFTTKSKEKGTGLGLSTVYGIVKQSGGFIWVYSEPGKGTTVKVYFPCEHEPAAAATLVTSPDLSIRGSETVLIVEDEEAVRALASRILRDRGYTVLEAADGMEALRIAQEFENRIHLVLTDVIMPGVGGRLLVSSLEEVRPGIKSLFISGYTDDAIVHQGILDTGVAFLQKPFSVEGLVRKVREVLNSR
jgi:two-component system, cell cycle sensor histidine kinase and response regulator CckA